MTPDAFTIQEALIDVGDGNQLYAMDWGNKKASLPIIRLHGGPGSRSKNRHLELFNPYEQRVILFDQRGCGRSLPYGTLENNTTPALVEDIEKIADYFKLERFVLTGSSWGSCLALAYALQHPRRIAALALQGVFTGSQAEIDYLDEGKFQTFFPDVWEAYLDQTPEEHRKHPTQYHRKRILGSNPEEVQASAYIYSNMESALMSLDDRINIPGLEGFDPSPTRIESYYLAHTCFLPDHYILDNAHKLTMPIWIVQGRYDFVCPPSTAYELHNTTRNSTLIWTMAGHGYDRSNYDVMRTMFAHWS